MKMITKAVWISFHTFCVLKVAELVSDCSVTLKLWLLEEREEVQNKDDNKGNMDIIIEILKDTRRPFDINFTVK